MGETISLEVNLRAYVRRDTKRRWIAVCPMIGVASQSTSAEAAKSCLQEAVELWFESCIERGVLDQALREANFRPLPHDVGIRRVADDEEEDVRGDDFSIHLTIPAYQASAFLGASA